MQERMLFGQYLSQFIHLSDHDVAEILEDQATSGRRFGEIALSWGLCEPQDVWRAWWLQLSHLAVEVDLNVLGVDSQAISDMPRTVAEEFNVIPVRSFADHMVVAVDPADAPRAMDELPQLLHRRVQFVYADAGQIAEMARHYYANEPTAALAG